MKSFLTGVLSAFFALVIVLLFLLVTGESPWALLEALQHTFFTSFGLGYTLFYTTSLIFCGLSVAFAFQAGLFNIGAEGQLLWGSMGVIALASQFPTLPFFLSIPLGIGACGLFGGLWGGLAGYLKAKRGAHEVISTILLNFIAVALTNYLILYTFKNPLSQAAETTLLPRNFWIPGNLFRTTPLNLCFFLALGLAWYLENFFRRTPLGFELRCMGGNQKASRFGGVNIDTHIVLSLFTAGVLAGLVGVNEVMGSEHQVIEGFSPGYGFMGIAVALVARNRPWGIVFSSFFFGSLYTFSREIEFFTEHLSKELSVVLQAILLLLFGTRHSWEPFLKREKS